MGIILNMDNIKSSADAYKKNQETYNHASDEIWQRVVYDNIHGGYEFANISGTSILDKLNKVVNLSRKSLLDIGCGSGDGSIYLAENFDCNVCGVDSNHLQILNAQNKVNQRNSPLTERVNFRVNDFSNTLANLEQYDVAISVDSFSLLVDLDRALLNLSQVLKLDGKFIIADVFGGPNVDQSILDFAWQEDGMVNLSSAEIFCEKVQQSSQMRITEREDKTDLAKVVFTKILNAATKLISDPECNIPNRTITGWVELAEIYLDAFDTYKLTYFWICGQRIA